MTRKPITAALTFGGVAGFHFSATIQAGGLDFAANLIRGEIRIRAIGHGSSGSARYAMKCAGVAERAALAMVVGLGTEWMASHMRQCEIDTAADALAYALAA